MKSNALAERWNREHGGYSKKETREQTQNYKSPRREHFIHSNLRTRLNLKKKHADGTRKAHADWKKACAVAFEDIPSMKRFPYPPLLPCKEIACKAARRRAQQPCRNNVRQFIEDGTGELFTRARLRSGEGALAPISLCSLSPAPSKRVSERGKRDVLSIAGVR